MEGIMVYEHDYDVWAVWIGQEPYCVEVNDQFDMMIGEQYLDVRITRDLQGEWNIIIEEMTTLTLRNHEIYKVIYTLFSYEKEGPI